MMKTMQQDLELREFIDSIYTRDLSNSLLAEQAERICRLMDSHYFATILFSNRYSIENYSFANNPADFDSLYFQLQNKDVMMHSMIAGQGPVYYDEVKRQKLPGHKEFFGELNPLRPVSDCCYVPMVLKGRICGFSGIARAGEGNRVFSREDRELYKHISGYLNESFVRSLTPRRGDEWTASLDADGNVLSAGSAVEEYFRYLFGDAYWKSPCSGGSYYSLLFTRHLRRFLDPLAEEGSGFLELPAKEHPASIEFTRMAAPVFRPLFRDQPQVRITLKQGGEAGRDQGILDWVKLRRRYDLTPGESDIIDCIYRGLSQKDIAVFLRIPEDELERRTMDIYGKTGAHSRSSLILSLI